jgi:hypothetical protein
MTILQPKQNKIATLKQRSIVSQHDFKQLDALLWKYGNVFKELKSSCYWTSTRISPTYGYFCHHSIWEDNKFIRQIQEFYYQEQIKSSSLSCNIHVVLEPKKEGLWNILMNIIHREEPLSSSKYWKPSSSTLWRKILHEDWSKFQFVIMSLHNWRTWKTTSKPMSLLCTCS